MIDSRVGIVALVALPALVVAVSYIRLDVERLRQYAVSSAIVMLLTALALAITSNARAVLVSGVVRDGAPQGEALLRIDALSSALLPFAAGLWLLTVAVTPRGALDRGGLRRTALATLVTVASFLTESALLLLLLWILSIWTFIAALSDARHRHQRRVVSVYLGLSAVLLAIGVALLIMPMTMGTRLEVVGVWLVALAAVIRAGIIPFHAWVPEVFDHGRLGPAILFSAPQLGAYVTVVLVVPRAAPDLLRVLAVLALATAVYGAGLALVQTSARRALGYLFVSQSSLVMAGLDCTSVSALAGGLLLWLSAGIAFAGLARCVLVLEARRGRLDLSTPHGGYERMPVLATSFLAMGLACTGFPGTLGFAGQELLVDGAVEMFPVMGFAVVVASALTGLAVLRMYFALFCGRRETALDATIHLGLTRREAWTFASLVIALVGMGVMPRPIADSRFAASEEILRTRQGLIASSAVTQQDAGP